MSWKTPELRAADADLRTAVEHGRRTLAQTQRLKNQIRSGRVSDKDIRLVSRPRTGPQVGWPSISLGSRHSAGRTG